MPNQYFDLNRTRKIYPLVRYRPRFVTSKESTEEIEVARIQFSGTSQKEYYFEKEYKEVPIVILTPENDNINVFITSISLEKVVIELSEIPDETRPCDVYVHLQAIAKTE